jgi:hypothetical protein
VLIGAVALSLLLVSPASAQTGYEGGGTITCNPATLQVGQQTTCTATGYAAGETVIFTLGGAQVASGTAGADGTVTVTFAIPNGTALGPHSVTATGEGGDGDTLVLSTTITVVAAGTQVATPGSTSGGGLPATGSNSIGWSQAALMLIAVGGLLVLASSKQRRSHREETKISA